MTTDAGTQQGTTAPWTADASTFGARLALVRQRMGWGNVKVAADKCGLPVESWRNWERDGMEPRRLTTIAMTIATATGCDYLWLVFGPGRGGSSGPTTGFAPIGDMPVPATRYAPGERVLATVGEDRRHGGPATRPVRQTQPMRPVARRPVTTVAV